MRCKTVRKLLEAYVEGELDESRRKLVEDHVSACESCRRELALTRSIPRLVSILPTPPVPEDVIPNTLRLLHEEPRVPWGWLTALGAFLSTRWKFAVAAALLVVGLLAGIGYREIGREPELTGAEVASAVKDLKLALGIVAAATQEVQNNAFSEGAKVLSVTRSKSGDAMQTISRTQLEVSQKLRHSLAALSQLKLGEVDQL